MAAPAGPCEWCGGPQYWTIIADEMYTMCQEGCLPLPLEGVVPPPPDGEFQRFSEIYADVMEQTEEGGVETPEGDAASTGVLPWDDDLPER